MTPSSQKTKLFLLGDLLVVVFFGSSVGPSRSSKGSGHTSLITRTGTVQALQALSVVPVVDD